MASSTFKQQSPSSPSSDSCTICPKMQSSESQSNITTSSKVLLLTYIWIDDRNKRRLRSRTQTVDFVSISGPEQLPLVRIEGGESGESGEFYLYPVKLYRDPIRRDPHRLVLCETVTDIDHLQPTQGNSRRSCLQTMKAAAAEAPWFGIEQEYFMMDATSGRVIGWPEKSGIEPNPIAAYSFAVGPDRIVGRTLPNLHYAACLYAGIKIDGLNAEGVLGQWEYQIGPCEGVTIGDDLVMSRYLLHRLAEDLALSVTFEPMPLPSSLFGSGAHTNFSTASTRAEGGMEVILKALKKLEARHQEHISVYDLDGGRENERRLVDGYVTAHFSKFTYGLGVRNVSVRVPAQTVADGRGYLEDRRPAANMDPYVVAEALVRTVCL